MRKYSPRVLWYLLVILIGLSTVYYPAKLLVNGYLSAASTYLPLSLFSLFLSYIFDRNGKVHATMFGVKSQYISFGMFAIGLVACALYPFLEKVFLAQFGVIFILIAVDVLLFLREGQLKNIHKQQ